MVGGRFVPSDGSNHITGSVVGQKPFLLTFRFRVDGVTRDHGCQQKKRHKHPKAQREKVILWGIS